MIAPVLLTAGHDAAAAGDYLRRAAVWNPGPLRPGVRRGRAGGPGTEAAWLLGSAFENGPPRRPCWPTSPRSSPEAAACTGT